VEEEENPSPSLSPSTSLSSPQASSPPHSTNENDSSNNKRTSSTCIGSASHSNDVCQNTIQKAYEEAGIDVSEDELIGLGMLVDSIDLFGDKKTEMGEGQVKREDSNVEETASVPEKVEEKDKEVCVELNCGRKQKEDLATDVIQDNDNDKGINIRNHDNTFRPKEPEPEPAPISTIYAKKNSSMTSQSPCSVLTNPTCLLERQGDDVSLATARSERVKLIKSRLRSLEGSRSRSYTSVRGRHLSRSRSHKSPVGTVVSLLPTTSSSGAEWSSPSAKSKHRSLSDDEELCVTDTDCCTSITSHSFTTMPASSTSSGTVATRIPSATEQTLRIAREAMMFVLLIVLASIAYLIYRDDHLHQLELQSKQLQVMEQMLLMKHNPELDLNKQRQITDGDGYGYGYEPSAIGSKTLPTPASLRISHQYHSSAEEKERLIQASFEQYMTGVTFDNVDADPSPFTSKISSTKKHPPKFEYLQSSSSFLRDVLEVGGNYQLYNHAEPNARMTALDHTSVRAQSHTEHQQEQIMSTHSAALMEPSFLECDGLENTPVLTMVEDDDVENIITRNRALVDKKETFVVMGVVINY